MCSFLTLIYQLGDLLVYDCCFVELESKSSDSQKNRNILIKINNTEVICCCFYVIRDRSY